MHPHTSLDLQPQESTHHPATTKIMVLQLYSSLGTWDNPHRIALCMSLNCNGYTGHRNKVNLFAVIHIRLHDIGRALVMVRGATHHCPPSKSHAGEAKDPLRSNEFCHKRIMTSTVVPRVKKADRRVAHRTHVEPRDRDTTFIPSSIAWTTRPIGFFAGSHCLKYSAPNEFVGWECVPS